MKKQLNFADGYKPIQTANFILLVCLLLVVLMFVVVTVNAKPKAKQNNNTYVLAAEIKKQLKDGQLELHFPASVKRFYEQRDFKESWVVSDNDAKQTWDAMLMIDCVLQFGLNHSDLHPTELLYSTLHDILEKPGMVKDVVKARYDIMLTDAMLTFINYLHYGKLNPLYPNTKIDTITSGNFSTVNVLHSAINSKNFTEVIGNAQPKIEEYKKLQYKMHLLTGLYQEDCYETPEAVIRKMAINMERLRWAAIDTSNSIQINIPSYSLTYYHKSIDTFKVIVGTPQNPTPSLQSQIKYFTTAPEWRVPAKIFIKELLPKTLKDTDYLQVNNFAIYNTAGQLINSNKQNLAKIKLNPNKYYARQSAGCDNALGVLVFRFDNVYNIYLHDTPDKRLFNRANRALSHGCIRVQNAVKLAALLLKNDGAVSKVPAMLKSIAMYKTKNFKLAKSIPINITYITCEVINGEIVNYKDIYNLDKSLELALYGDETLTATK